MKHVFPAPVNASVVQSFSLDPTVAFLNHGSFGACPRVVLDAQWRLRQQLEMQPVQFFARELSARLDEARRSLATFVGADPEDLAWVDNATTGVNTVLRSLRFEAGDEILTTSHDYNACRNALRFVAERASAKVVVAQLPFPLHDPGQVVECVLDASTPKTKLALLDHVTSATGLVFPIEKLVRALRDRGIDTLVDGAHAAGMVDLQLTDLGATYYTANCHKWLCAPKGAAFLYVDPTRRSLIRPLTISHGANAAQTSERDRFRLEFDWTGTRDPTAQLCVPVAIDFLQQALPGGVQEVRRRNRRMVLAGRELLCTKLGIDVPAPQEMIGSLASIALPPMAPSKNADYVFADTWQRELYERYRVEVPVFFWPSHPQRLLRISGQIYNTESDYQRLLEGLLRLGAATE